MSTTTTANETVSVDAQAQHDGDSLATIVAQTIPVEGDLADFDGFCAVCDATRDTIRRVAGEEVER